MAQDDLEKDGKKSSVSLRRGLYIWKKVDVT
jgi:hypothetical protein